jgi:predicted PurR-regulated permease PerM
MTYRTTDFLTRVLIVLAVALVPLLIWYLRDVVLMTMGAVLVAILLRLGAEPLREWFKLPWSLALGMSGLIIVSVLAGAAFLFGTEISVGLQEVLIRAEEAQKTITGTLRRSALGNLFLAHAQGSNLPLGQIVGQLFSMSANVLEGMVVTMFAGIYLAVQPSLYRSGLSKLFPWQCRERANETIDTVGDALRLWLLGQLLQMLLVGLLSTCATWLIGLPSPFTLGLIAGIAEFVPYIGPIVASIPAILVATTLSSDAVVWTVIAYVVIQQAEGQLISPLIQQRMVFIPPALMLLSIVSIGFLFGATATFLAAPITVVLFVVVNKLYVRDGLGERVAIPGESS